MLKRTLSMLLVLVLALGMLPVTAGAAGSGKHTLNIPKTYSVTFDETENNGSRNTADYFGAEDAIVNGEVGNPTAGDYYDWYVFKITSSHHLSLDAIGGAGGENTTVFGLYNSTGNLIKNATYLYEYDTDDWYNLEVDLDPGTYYIRVSDVNNWVAYQFSTYLRPMLDAPTVSLSNRASDGKVKISWNAVNYASSYRIVRATSQNGSYTTIATVTGTSYYDSSAVAGTTYWYKVQALHHNANRLDSRFSDAKSRACDLAKPTNVKTTRSASTGKVKISWNAVSGADKYELYCSTNGGSSWTKLTTITGTSVNHGSATVGTTYTYRVRAIDTGNSSANSAYSSTVTGTAVCAKPVITVSNVASTGKIKISWDAISGAAKYTVYIYDANGNLLKSSSTTGTSLTHSSAEAGVNYTYKVKAIGSTSAANSSYSSAKSRTCDLAAPKMSLTNTAEGKIKLSWNKVTGADKYDVYYSTDGTSWSKLKTVTGTSLTHGSATAGKTYYYRVRAVYSANSSANSAWSGSVSGKAISVLAAPSLSLTNTSAGKIKLSWNEVSGADKYSVYYSTDGSSYSLLKTVTGTSLTHSSATAGKTYYYKVMAVDADNSASNSGYSNVVTGEVIVSEESGLAAPSLTVVENSAGKPKLTWTKVTDATKYKVYYSTDDGITWTLLKTMTGSSLTHSSALEGLTYSYKVAAANDSATSPYSNVVSITSK